ncbi:TonB-dependent receptor [Oxalobacteraceae bacterium A2-2]
MRHAAALAALLLALGARAQEAARTFDIPAGPAAAAIADFARQAGVNVLASSDSLGQVRTNQVQGALGVEEALRRLLAGTPLSSRINSNGAVFIMMAPAAAAPPAVAAPQHTEAQARAEAAAEGAVLDPDPWRVVIVGARLAEQTSIERKKYAATARDSIVADDVGTFPDRNVAEAISRIAGVTMSRNDFGEGETVSVRGNGPELTRVEIDGMAVSSPGGTDLVGGGGGRGVELRELPSDLIASVDVVKGATADMTEGSLGGAIIIKTRTGLDFSKRTIVLRSASQYNTVNRSWSPNLNLIFADQLADGRLGLVANLSRVHYYNESHRQNVSGYTRDIDFDNSPDKTFALNPAALRESTVRNAAGALLAREPVRVIGGSAASPLFRSLSPLEIAERSYQARSKTDCYAAFPAYTAAQLPGLGASQQRDAQLSRINERLSCLRQWADYVPGLSRYWIRSQDDARSNADLRLDFKVNRSLSVYAKFGAGSRRVEDQDNRLGLAQPAIAADAAMFSDTPGTPLSPSVRSVTALGAASGYYLWPGMGASVNAPGGAMADGIASTIVPGSVSVDSAHHVTDFVTSGGDMGNDVTLSTMESRARSSQFGGRWRSGALHVDVLYGRTRGDFLRYGVRGGAATRSGRVRATLGGQGIWHYQPLDGEGGTLLGDPSRLLGMNVDPATGRLVSVPSVLRTENLRATETGEDLFKADFSYGLGDMLPLLKRVKWGASRRAYVNSTWYGGGYEYQSAAPGREAVTVPTANMRSTLQACENTPATVVPCAYGVVNTINPRFPHDENIVVTRQQYVDLLGSAMVRQTNPLFNGSSLGGGAVTGWNYLDLQRFFAGAGLDGVDTVCLKECVGSDGRVYAQPNDKATEQVTAGYVSTDFALPLGMDINGNFGWRYVHTRAAGQGLLTFAAISGNSTTSLTRNTEFKGSSTDLMPVLNLAAWLAPNELVFRYNRAKSIARPAIASMISSGVTCTYNANLTPGQGEYRPDDPAMPDQACNGIVGNPSLKPRTNINQNFSLEWYANRDSMLSATWFHYKGIVGEVVPQNVSNMRPFEGTGLRDPATGRPLSELQYSYRMYVNGDPYTSSGMELSGKTAFSRLPWLLRHTGASASYTRLRSQPNGSRVFEQMTGDELPVRGQARHSWNLSLWYDDGALNMRAAVQASTSTFAAFSSSGYNLPVNQYVGNINLPYQPGLPVFIDAYRYVDARIGYKFRNGIELFIEGRNLNNYTNSASSGPYGAFADVPAYSSMAYGGKRFLLGMVIRN